MKNKGISFSGENLAVLAYETTWTLGWSNVLDIAQVFLNDISDDVQLMQYIDFGEGTDVDSIDSILERNRVFQEEHMGISLAGVSKTMEMPIRLTLFNQLCRADVHVMLLSDSLRKQFKEDPQTLDTYMDSIEISGYMRRAEKNGIDIVHAAMIGRSEHVECYKTACYDLNIEPNRHLL